MAEGSGSSKEGNKDKQLSEAQAGIKALSLSDSQRQQHLDEIFRQASEMTMRGQDIPTRGKEKSRVTVVHESSSSMHFKEHQLKQLRAQYVVYRAFSKGVAPKEQHLEIALGTTFSGEGD